MASPFMRSVFKPTDFDLFLDEIGLSEVTGNDRIELVDRFSHAVKYAIVNTILRKLPIDKQTEWIHLMQVADKDGNEAPVNEFLERELPEIETLVDEAIDNVKNEFRISTASLSSTIDQQLAMLQRGQNKSAEDYKVEDLGIPNPEELNIPEQPDPTLNLDEVRDQISSIDSAPEPEVVAPLNTTNPVADELEDIENNPSIG